MAPRKGPQRRLRNSRAKLVKTAKQREQAQQIIEQTVNEKHAHILAIIEMLKLKDTHNIPFPEQVDEKFLRIIGKEKIGDFGKNEMPAIFARGGLVSWAWGTRKPSGEIQNRFILKYPATDENQHLVFVIRAGEYEINGQKLTAKIDQVHVFDAAGNEIESNYRQ